MVKPQERTTLFLTPAYMPFQVGTARAAFYNLLKGKGSGIDANGNPFKWDQYISNNISVFPDQPVMRSGFNAAYSSNVWSIPTVFVVNSSFFYKRKKPVVTKVQKGLAPLKEVYDFYRGVCCFCYEKISFSEASREHIFPVSHHRCDDDSNIALACRDCNSRAGSVVPKLDIHGNEIQAKFKPKPAHFTLPNGLEARKEWLVYLMGAH